MCIDKCIYEFVQNYEKINTVISQSIGIMEM